MTTKISLAYVPNSSHAVLFKPGEHELKPFEDRHGFAMTVGSCMVEAYPKNRADVGRYWMVHFHHAVVRDGVDAKVLHRVLMDIPEFRDMCAHDIPLMSLYNDFNDL